MPDSNLIAQLGARIRDARRKARMNGQELAEKIGMSQSYISEIERGNRSPALSTLAAIADALGEPISHFFPNTSEEKPAFDTSLMGLGDLDKSFGELVSRKMREKEISLEQLAKASGVSVPNLARILHGFVPNRPLVLRLAEVLDANPNLFLIAAGYIPRDLTHQHLIRLLADPYLQEILGKVAANFPTEDDKRYVIALLDEALEQVEAQ